MLREEAYTKFKQCLFGATLRPGQFVSQRELCEIVGVPLGPMREALKRLEAEALVKLVAQRGIQIVDVNLELIKNSAELRMVLETEAIRKFALHASEARILRHHDAFLRALERAANGPISKELLEATYVVDRAFHDDIVTHLNNEMITDVHRATMEKFQLIRLKGQMTESRLEPVTREHIRITQALARRDADASVAALQSHLAMVQARAMGIETLEIEPRSREP